MGAAAKLGSGEAAAGEETVAAGFVRALMDLAVAKGADRAALARRSGLDPAALEDPDRRVPFARYKALMRAGQELSGDPALALHFGAAFHITELSIVGLMGQARPPRPPRQSVHGIVGHRLGERQLVVRAGE